MKLWNSTSLFAIAMKALQRKSSKGGQLITFLSRKNHVMEWVKNLINPLIVSALLRNGKPTISPAALLANLNPQSLYSGIAPTSFSELGRNTNSYSESKHGCYAPRVESYHWYNSGQLATWMHLRVWPCNIREAFCTYFSLQSKIWIICVFYWYFPY